MRRNRFTVNTKVTKTTKDARRLTRRVPKYLRACFAFIVSFVFLVARGDARRSDTYPAVGGDITITTFVHSSLQLEHAGKVIQIDPWSVGDLSRAKQADLIVITDDPGHHLDVKAIAALRKPGAPVVLPQGNRSAGTPVAQQRVPDGRPLGNGESGEFAGVRVEAVAAYDLSPGDPYHPKGEANGYIITLGGRRVYIAGVTECVPEIRALKAIDVVFFPLNLPLARMEPAAAIDCLRVIKPKVAYLFHYDQEWVTAVGRGGPRPAPTTRGLAEVRDALKADGIEVRLADWYPR